MLQIVESAFLLSQIKSDKEELHAEEHEEHITKLQDHTVKHIKEVHVEYEGGK